ncbi:MAG: hypothetical protein WB800_04765 [Streptosporangiaceae bacterium]
MTVQAGDSSPGIAGGAEKRTTFHGTDPDNAAEATICKPTPTGCQARTRLYRNGTLELEGFPIADISEHLRDPATVCGWTCETPTARTSTCCATSSACTR